MRIDDTAALHEAGFTLVRSWVVEDGFGEDLTIGLASCMRCGAAVLLDPQDEEDFKSLHLRWHGAL